MNLFASLRNRIFLTTALLTVLSIGVAIYLVNLRVTGWLEPQLQRELVASSTLVAQLRDTRVQTFTTMARLLADSPKLKAAVDTNDPPTVQDTLNSYRDQAAGNLLLVTNKDGVLLASIGTSAAVAQSVARLPSVRDALSGRESGALLPQKNGLVQVIAVPIAVGLSHPDILGTLSVGFPFDDALAASLKDITGSDIVFSLDGEILATTLPEGARQPLGELLRRSDRSGNVTLASIPYVALPLPLTDKRDSGTDGAGPIALILRSRNEQLQVLTGVRNMLAFTAVVAVLLATLLSFAVARTITQPLASITGTMREVATTGDLTRKIVLGAGRRWNDADAQLLANTFNMLTDSIARFQREMSQKERLSSLGRLSTVIAHEVRNPLMIIKASLHALRQSNVSSAALLEAVSDIDGEIVRLNRIVSEVLDFARPIQFEMAIGDLNAICRDSAAAAAAGPGAPVTLDLDPSLPPLSTDAERLRLALVNLIVNARQALAASSGSTTEPDDGRRVVVQTRWTDGRIRLTISDNGPGIAAADLPRIFDPYFTTKRGGTGLGLPIAKSVVEGLGGVINVQSNAHGGTDVKIDFPADAVNFVSSESLS
ncbi:MAG TPA: ATP-binding protein [Vicinamibacterales bacterium]|nr:ATP-binding protein [Vicinamibacterales bacterium]